MRWGEQSAVLMMEAKLPQGRLVATRSQKRQGRNFLQSFQREIGLPEPYFGLLVSGIMREYISYILNHCVSSSMLQQPQESNTDTYLGYQVMLKYSENIINIWPKQYKFYLPSSQSRGGDQGQKVAFFNRLRSFHLCLLYWLALLQLLSSRRAGKERVEKSNNSAKNTSFLLPFYRGEFSHIATY